MGVKMENHSSSLILLRNLIITPLFLSTDKPLSFISSHKSKLFHVLRSLFVYIFVLIFHLVHSLGLYLPFSSTRIGKHRDHVHHDHEQLVNSSMGRGGDTAIARAIYQLLSLVNSIPTSSRKYEVVRSLAETLIDDNLKEGSETLRQINCVVLSEAFGKTLSQLEAALLVQESNPIGPGGFGLGRVVRAAKGWCQVKEVGGPAVEKMAAELLWLAQKMDESGGREVVVEKWACARNLGWLALAAEPRVQAPLVKLTG